MRVLKRKIDSKGPWELALGVDFKGEVLTDLGCW
jgi:hypothetical protein